MIRALAILACVLTVCITGASAFIRHSQGGLGCAGWPHCYRQAAQAATQGQGAGPAHGAAEGASVDGGAGAGGAGATPLAPSAEPDPAVRAVRALHRVSAVAVGLLALGLLLFGWRGADRLARPAIALAFAVTALLAWLGRMTPHDLPAVAIGNVLGGFMLAACFGWIAGRPAVPRAGAGVPGVPVAWPGVAGVASAMLALVALLAVDGVLMSVRRAVDACPALACLPAGAPDPSAFDPVVAMASLDPSSAVAMHLAHRVVALVLAALAVVLAMRLARRGATAAAIVVAAIVVTQFALGLSTAHGLAPLIVATAHNALAALACGAFAALAARAARFDAG